MYEEMKAEDPKSQEDTAKEKPAPELESQEDTAKETPAAELEFQDETEKPKEKPAGIVFTSKLR